MTANSADAASIDVHGMLREPGMAPSISIAAGILAGRRRAMHKIEIYTRAWCGYCHMAESLLTSVGCEFREYDIGDNVMLERELARAGCSYCCQGRKYARQPRAAYLGPAATSYKLQEQGLPTGNFQ
jgi:hypothetical protein